MYLLATEPLQDWRSVVLLGGRLNVGQTGAGSVRAGGKGRYGGMDALSHADT